MDFLDFLFEKITILLLHLFSSVAFIIFVKIMGLETSAIWIIGICWFFIVFMYFIIEFHSVKRKYEAMNRMLQELDQKYLIKEMLSLPDTMLEKVYYDMLGVASKSMIEEVGKAKEGQQSYKEYIEKWIHEIKTPITAIDLICNNHETAETKRIKVELKQIYYLVEQALYYARSEIVEKDYFIKRIRLFDVVQTSILSHRIQMLEHRVTLEVEETEEIVHTDEKWLNYIINQIFINAMKYKKEGNATIKIYTNQMEQGVELVIEDNGVGISEVELPRIFEKGFTGIDRSNHKSTGIGLYLCKKLCDKLGLQLFAESKKGQYTRIKVFFPIGKYTRDTVNHE